MIQDPILQHPDFSSPFYVTTDASNMAVGGVLSQKKDGFDFPIAFASRCLNSAEIKYSTIEKELLAILCKAISVLHLWSTFYCYHGS